MASERIRGDLFEGRAHRLHIHRECLHLFLIVKTKKLAQYNSSPRKERTMTFPGFEVTLANDAPTGSMSIENVCTSPASGIPTKKPSWCDVEGLRSRVQGSGFRVQGLGFEVWGLGFGAANPEGVRRQVGDLREEGEVLLRGWGLGFRDWSWMIGVPGL